MCDRLVGNGMEVVGATPMRIGWQPVRPLEILSWLKAYNEGAGTEERPRVTQFVAVDDRPLLQEHGGEGLRGNAHAARPPPRSDRCQGDSGQWVQSTVTKGETSLASELTRFLRP